MVLCSNMLGGIGYFRVYHVVSSLEPQTQSAHQSVVLYWWLKVPPSPPHGGGGDGAWAVSVFILLILSVTLKIDSHVMLWLWSEKGFVVSASLNLFILLHCMWIKICTNSPFMHLNMSCLNINEGTCNVMYLSVVNTVRWLKSRSLQASFVAVTCSTRSWCCVHSGYALVRCADSADVNNVTWNQYYLHT